MVGEVAYTRHVAGKTRVNQHSGVETECIRIVGIKVGRVGATSFVTEEVVLRGEFTAVLSVLGHLLKTLCHHLRQKALCLDERHLHIAVAVAVKAELECDVLRE